MDKITNGELLRNFWINPIYQQELNRRIEQEMGFTDAYGNEYTDWPYYSNRFNCNDYSIFDVCNKEGERQLAR